MPPNTQRPLRVYVLPVSGGLFAVQMGLLAAISATNTIARADGFVATPLTEEKPDIVLASSGGNLAAYSGLSADWSRERIYKIADILRSNMFLSPWSESTPSWLFLPFLNSIFRPGYSAKNVFNFLFTEGSIHRGQTEIWTGVFHRRTGKQRLVVNKAQDETWIKPFSSQTDSEDAGPLQLGADKTIIYANGDRDIIADASLASASIPWLVQPVTIDNERYSDGGSMFASPLATVDGDIEKLAKGNDAHILRLVYFSSESLTQDRKATNSMIGEIKNLLFATSSCDIRVFINLILRLGANSQVPVQYHRLNAHRFSKILANLDASNKHYAVILYPESPTDINMLSLDDLKPIDIRRIMARVENEFGAAVWKSTLP